MKIDKLSFNFKTKFYMRQRHRLSNKFKPILSSKSKLNEIMSKQSDMKVKIVFKMHQRVSIRIKPNQL